VRTEWHLPLGLELHSLDFKQDTPHSQSSEIITTYILKYVKKLIKFNFWRCATNKFYDSKQRPNDWYSNGSL